MQFAEIFMVLLLALAVPTAVVFVLCRWTRLGNRRWWPRSFARPYAALLQWWRWLAYAFLLGLLFRTADDPGAFGCPLLLSNILFTDPNAAPASACQQSTLRLLVNNNGAGLLRRSLECILWIVVLSLATRYVTMVWPWRRLANTPFALLLTIYTIMLPMLYGVLRTPVEFPEVEVSTIDDHPPVAKDRLFLLNRGDKEFLLFAAGLHKVIWLREDRVEYMEVKGVKLILAKP